jgi:AcrR family transcriptional regulator
MRNGVRWRRLPEERPQQILDAAFEVFGEHGLAGARLDDIAKRAGVAKGTIYLYFPNKEALFKEMIRQTVIAHLERSERDLVADRGTSATDQLRDYMQGLWSLTRSPAYQVVMRLVIAELHRFPELMAFYWDEVVSRKRQFLDRLFRRGIEAGEFRSIDPQVAGRMMASMFAMHALWVSSGVCAPTPPTTDEELFEQLTDFFFHAVAPVGVTAPGSA